MNIANVMNLPTRNKFRLSFFRNRIKKELGFVKNLATEWMPI